MKEIEFKDKKYKFIENKGVTKSCELCILYTQEEYMKKGYCEVIKHGKIVQKINANSGKYGTILRECGFGGKGFFANIDKHYRKVLKFMG